MAHTPASVRHRNPGAQWPGPVADKWGSTGFEVLQDGQGNKIATFPTWEQGAAAHLDLLRSGYKGLPLEKAIAKWSGGNNVDDYVARVSRETGLGRDAVISDELLRSPQGMALVKSMAGHEKGRNGEGVPDEAWSKAYAMVFGGAPQQADTPAPAQTRPDVSASAPTAAPRPTGGLLDGLFQDKSAFEPLFGRQPEPQAPQAVAMEERRPEQPAAEDMQPAAIPQGQRRPVDMARVLAILQQRSRLGSA